jgi:hypothetical protein
VHWQENPAGRHAGETGSLDIEIGNLADHELENILRILRTAHAKVLEGCDTVRQLPRQTQSRHETVPMKADTSST